MPMPRYKINEVFLSVQGEGFRQGESSFFVRFSGCNLRCAIDPGKKSPGGFACDTEFLSGRKITADELLEWLRVTGDCKWIILTGGEPMMQVDDYLIERLHNAGYKLAIETNGSYEVPDTIDFISVSPKVAEHCIKQKTADEVRYVRGYGQALPRTVVKAKHHYISPAFNGVDIDEQTVEWCQKLIEDDSLWELSFQMHKVWDVR